MDGVCLVGVELQLHFGHDFDMTRLHSTKLFTEQVYAAAFTHYGDMLLKVNGTSAECCVDTRVPTLRTCSNTIQYKNGISIVPLLQAA